jgi:NAD(P)-dependent dehydrogenase (short-subunit alcohol dehydrogenase family)
MRMATRRKSAWCALRRTTATPTWLITGWSTRLGSHRSEDVLSRWHAVVVTARAVATVADFSTGYLGTALPVTLDVTSTEQVAAATRTAIDILVNNAGYGYRAAVEEGEPGGVQNPFDTNFFEAVAMLKNVLPGMRARDSGSVVNI